MPICKNCHHSITRFDEDVCPYCGTEHPIEDGYVTKDMTSFVDPVASEYKLYKSKSRRLSATLCLFLGMFGIHNFYLGFKKVAIIELIITTILIAGGGTLLGFFLAETMPFFSWYLIFFGVLFIFYALRSFHYFLKDSLCDASGEFLR